MQFGPRSTGVGGGGYSAPTGGKSEAPAPQEQLETIEYPEEDINPDDIPF